LKPGENKTYTAKLYRAENLTTPKVVFMEDPETTVFLTTNETIKPTAIKNATRIFNFTITNPNSLIAVSMPIYRSNETNETLLAYLEKISAKNATFKVEGRTVYISPEIEVSLKFEGRKLGDVNNDGKVSIVDALFIAQYSVGKRKLDSESINYGNVNGDSSLRIVDALFIAQYLVGKRDEEYRWKV
ncbi:MAG: dockerin type I repeat-containing protein, partial [Archaeoglobaceae archaeon]|nr:dockerin type I repeat-containing protein [Archaeoglobaceae archaeon]